MSDKPSTQDLAVERTEMASGRTAMATERTDLAFERTRFASERTLMAFLRTSVSLIGFGFTIYKFFQYMVREKSLSNFPAQGPRNLGLALIILGAGILALAIVQHILFLRRLTRESGNKMPVSTALVGSFLFLAIGILALINIIFRVGPF